MPESIAHFYAGPVLVYANRVKLGYSVNDVTVRIETKYADHTSDQWGGSRGVPSDSQAMGTIAHCNLQLAKFDETVMKKVVTNKPGHQPATYASITDTEIDEAWGQNLEGRQEAAGGTDLRTAPEMGKFVRQNDRMFELRLKAANQDDVWLFTFMRHPPEYNSGTIARVYNLGFEMWMSDPTDQITYNKGAGGATPAFAVAARTLVLPYATLFP